LSAARRVQLARLASRPWLWPRVLHTVMRTAALRWRQPDFRMPAVDPGTDPELILDRHRGNTVLRRLADHTLDESAAEFARVLELPDLADDTYSASQRLAVAAYLRRLGAPIPGARAIERLRADACRVAQQPEFRLQNAWFNNHLLNNYRAIELLRTQLPAEWHPAGLEARITWIEQRLRDNLGTLFPGGRGPILAEGSLSYELLILRHLVDLACCGSPAALPRMAREWLGRAAAGYVARLRWRDRWLLPAIGDLSPDWRTPDIHDFLDGVFLDRDTVYRRIWATELAALGLHGQFARVQGS
jgi:hypothetical protein